ncbi:MAG: alkaline phosphatase [Bradymonadaceae bacterium]
MSDDLPPGFEVLDERPSVRLDRREFLAFVGTSLAASACRADGPAVTEDTGGYQDPERRDTSGRDSSQDTWGEDDPAGDDTSRMDTETEGDGDASFFGEIPSDPFQLGVASGDPTPERVVLWTRLIPEPPSAGQMPSRDIPVIWEIAEGEAPAGGVVAGEFDESAIVRSGTVMAKPNWGHSVHVDAAGLEPDSWYTYRFRIGDRWTSRVGQTRTLPGPDAQPESFRVVTACCQSYPEGYFTPHHHIAREEQLDAVLFLGDYIYEESDGTIMRPHPEGVPGTLEEFRHRYALYKGESQLREAHAHCPWIVTWDDHEVRNNYGGDEALDFEYSV